MKVLVCGGAGFIGSVVVRNLLKNNFDTIVLDNLSTGNKEAVGNTKFVVCDLLDKNALHELFQKTAFSCVIHLAILHNTLESFEKPYLYFNNNFQGTLNLLECMREFNVKKIIFSSSAVVYGKTKISPVTEDSPLSIENVFAETIYMIEKLLGWYDLVYGVKAVSLRGFEMAGATIDGALGENKKANEGVISTLVKAASTDGVFRLYGTDFATRDGSFVRDYLHVEDLAEAFVKAIEYLFRNPRSEIFNVGFGEGYSVKEVITAVEAQTGRKLTVLPQPRRKWEVDEIWPTISKLKTQLNWQPKHTLTDIIQTSLYFHAKHPSGYSA